MDEDGSCSASTKDPANFPIARVDEIDDKARMGEPATTLTPASESESDASSAYRLVIRVKFAREEPPPAPVQPRFNLRVLLAILLPALAALSWLGVSMFKTDRPAKSAVAVVPAKAKAEPAPAETPMPAASPSSSTNEVIPKVSPGARDTIRGTIRVSVRMIVDREGKVVAATLEEAGPSRYFARLAVEAAKKWTFTPSDSKQQRIALVRFNFAREATTANLSSLH